MRFRKYLESLDDFFKDIGKSKIVSKENKIVPYKLELYRGFNGDLNTLEQDDNYYILSPKRSEQGMIWFTHRFISHYDPIEYAKNHGDWFMTYHLDCKRHIQINKWDDGTTSQSVPDDWYKLAEPTSNSRFHAGIELPEGWLFSYKMEKFVGCTIKIKVPKKSVVPSHE